jgi:site-specific DNA recombinase
MVSRGVALYARVSTDQQARDNTIASQVAALHERIAAEDDRVLPEHIYIDEGYSGAGLVRPALERLRDAVAMGLVGRLYVHAPDRLARRYAHQVLLIEELRRAGTEVVFLNHPIGGTAEDDLLLQVQGVIAEYERAKILERGRRGRRHAARSGSLSAFTTAPYGYRYVSKANGGGTARFEVIEEEACVVQKMFEWVALERVSLREVCRRLVAASHETRGGQSHWHPSTVRGMLTNTAYIGRAVYGHSRYVQAPPRLRPIRGHPHGSPRPTGRIAVPRNEWIEVPVPALVDEPVFETVAAQLAENGRRKRDRLGEAHWLLQGLTVCVRCGYAYYGKTSPRSKVDRSAGKYRHYRCAGTDGDRFGGKAVCDNQSVNADRLEAAVWERVRAVLEAPEGVAAEHRRRLRVAREPTATSENVARIERQIAALRRGTDRLIDAFTAGIIDRAEFEPRIAGLKARSAQLEAECQAARDAGEAERQLVLVLARLEDFAARVRDGLDRIDWHGRRDLIRTLVRRIEIDANQVEVVFRLPAPAGHGPPPPPPVGGQPIQQDCTADAPANPARFTMSSSLAAWASRSAVKSWPAARWLQAAAMFDFRRAFRSERDRKVVLRETDDPN